MMTQIEMDVARSTVRKNKAVAEYYENQNAVHDCIDWEQRRYEIAKELFPSIIQNIDLEATLGSAVDATIKLTDLLIDELKKEPTK
ncbi:MAG: hypothetical protein IJT48_00955 [Bacteroidaceae bacterium]|nr:hypothetical protein [Bacteroidaceae bacterium]